MILLRLMIRQARSLVEQQMRKVLQHGPTISLQRAWVVPKPPVRLQQTRGRPLIKARQSHISSLGRQLVSRGM